MEQPNRIFAFISYNHKDVKWAKWLRRKLEWYRLPSELHNVFDDSRYIRPVFRDRDELNSGVLNDELRNRLAVSKYLIVICSPYSARSRWVSDEVQAFIDMGRAEHIIPFIVSDDVSSMPLALKQWNGSHPNLALLGIAVDDDGRRDRQKAFIRLVSKLLEVDFETLWKRNRRIVRSVVSLATATIVLALVLAYWFMIPVQMFVTIADEQAALPGMESGSLFVNGVEYGISHPDTTIAINALPGCFRLRSLPVTFIANRYYRPVEMVIDVTAGVSQNMVVQLHRDSTFALFAGTVMDESAGVCNAKVQVGNKYALTDSLGHFSISFCVEEQTEFKPVRITHPNYQTKIRDQECPGNSLGYCLSK